MSLDSSSSLILTIIIMPTSCEFTAAHPHHRSFYPLTSKSSSSSSSLPSPTFFRCPKIHSLLYHGGFPRHGPSSAPVPPPPQSHPALPRKVCSPLRALPCFSLPAWKRLLGTIHADINTSFLQTLPAALLQREPQGSGGGPRQAGAQPALSPLSSRGCQVPAMPFDPPLPPINRPNEPTTASVKLMTLCQPPPCPFAVPSFAAPLVFALRLRAFRTKHRSPRVFPTRGSTNVANNRITAAHLCLLKYLQCHP